MTPGARPLFSIPRGGRRCHTIPDHHTPPKRLPAGALPLLARTLLPLLARTPPSLLAGIPLPLLAGILPPFLARTPPPFLAGTLPLPTGTLPPLLAGTLLLPTGTLPTTTLLPPPSALAVATRSADH